MNSTRDAPAELLEVLGKDRPKPLRLLSGRVHYSFSARTPPHITQASQWHTLPVGRPGHLALPVGRLLTEHNKQTPHGVQLSPVDCTRGGHI
jgi:hypothetical protein